MDSLSYKTVSANRATVNKQWILIDAENEVLGRLSSRVAKILRGKHKTCYTPNIDTGDCVIVLNAEHVVFTGKKMQDKQYVRHTGHPGGQRFANPSELMEKKPIAILESAVRGMLPKNILGRAMFRKLKVYAGSEHPHEAQNPKF